MQTIRMADILEGLSRAFHFTVKQWKWALVSVLVGILIALGYGWLQEPKYEAKVTFILEEKSSGIGGSLSGIASQFGIDIESMSGVSGMFTGDNILDILVSRSIIEKVLLTKIDTAAGANSATLADLYYENSGIKKKLSKKNELFKSLSYAHLNINTPHSLPQDSVLFLMHEELIEQNLKVERLNKKGSIIKILTKASNPVFAKVFSERLLDETRKLYVEVKTGISAANVNRLEKRADSLLRIMNNKSYQSASLQVLDANAAFKTSAVPAETTQRDRMVTYAIYTEVMKNLEMSRMAVANQTPVTQILDRSKYPLQDLRKSYKLLALIGAVLGLCLFLGFVFISFPKKGAQLILMGLILLPSLTKAQTIPVGMIGYDDQIRILQLQGKLGAEHSLMARPFFTYKNFTTDSFYQLTDPGFQYQPLKKKILNQKVNLELLPLHFYTKFNSNRPYSFNQPGFIQAKGIQNNISTGIYASSGCFSIQFKPEFSYANNPSFPYNNNFGAPTRGAYSQFFLGQSSIRITKNKLSFGLSTENIYWGPGLHNSLLMSANAPGFAHLTFNTTAPIKTPIGNFEWQLIGGKLVEDTALLLENKLLSTNYYNRDTYDGTGNSGPYDPKKSWRYLSGITLTYNPKWVKGLFLSINRVGYAYHYKIENNAAGYTFMQRYFPVLFGVLRESYPFGTPTNVSPVGIKQIASISARFLFPQSHAEMYMEYGYGDNFTNLRDWNTDAPHSTAYLVGFRKLKEIKPNKWLDFSAEYTRMSEPINYLLRSAGNWYTYEGGYTNQNRILGAGVGSGNNVFTAKLNWLDGLTKLGMTIQNIFHGPTTIVGGLNNFGLRDTKWNDMAIGINGQKRFKKFILSGELQTVNAKNYGWEMGNNRFNLYGFLTATYLW